MIVNLLRLARASLLVLIIIPCESVLAADQLTGAWHGTILGKSIELALWHDRRDTGSEWLEWKGYFYSPHYDCVMTAHVSYKGEKTAVSFTSLDIENRQNNCRNNLKGKRSVFKSDGRFDLQRLPTELSSVFEFLMFDDFKLAPKETESMVLHRGVSSDEMLAFIQEHKHRYILKPSPSDLAILNNKSPATAPKQLNKSNLYNTTSKKPQYPSSISNFYIVGENGGVSVLQDNENRGNNKLNSYSQLRSKFQRDAGVEKDQYLGWRRYDPSNGLIYNQPIEVKVSGRLREYCRSLKGVSSYSWLKPYQLPDGKYVSNIWRVIPKSQKGDCLIATFTSEGCRSTKCHKYHYSKALATTSKMIALDLARKRQQKESMNYNEVKNELDRTKANLSRTGARESMKSYEESGGVCGAVSCMQEDSDFALEW